MAWGREPLSRFGRRRFLTATAGFAGVNAAVIAAQESPPGEDQHRALRLVDTPGERISFKAGDRLLFEYRYHRDRPKTYVHPLCAPNGMPVTLDGPTDHVHHRGLMLAWSDVNGVDFWGEVNPGVHGQIVHQRFERIDGRRVAGIRSLNHWVAQGKVLLTERRTLVAVPLSSDVVWLDWESELMPSHEPVKLSAAEHVYNGLGIRFAASMGKGNVLNAQGAREVKRANGEQATWCTYYGAMEGVGQVGVVIFSHPRNPRHPTPFFVMNEPFGYLSAAPTFREPFHLPLGGSLHLRYAVGVYLGAPDQDRLDWLFNRWSRQPQTSAEA